MEFTFYYTEVTWCWWEENIRKTAQEAAIVWGQSHAHAASIIEDNYGDELVSIDKIEQISEGGVLPLSILSGRALRDAALNYGAAEIIEEKDFSKKTDEAIHIGPDDPLPKDVEPGTVVVQHYDYEYVNKTPKQIHWNPNTTPFPADTPQGTVIICDATYAQNWEGVAP